MHCQELPRRKKQWGRPILEPENRGEGVPQHRPGCSDGAQGLLNFPKSFCAFRLRRPLPEHRESLAADTAACFDLFVAGLQSTCIFCPLVSLPSRSRRDERTLAPFRWGWTFPILVRASAVGVSNRYHHRARKAFYQIRSRPVIAKEQNSSAARIRRLLRSRYILKSSQPLTYIVAGTPDPFQSGPLQT